MLLRSASVTLCLFAFLLSSALGVSASPNSTSGADSGGPPGSQNLNLESTDPLASFRQLQFRSNFNTSRWQRDNGSTDYEFRAIFPFRAWNRPNIIRFILPFNREPEDTSALKDIEVSDLAVFDQCWGQVGLGLSATIATNHPFEESDASLGPVAAFVVKPNDRFQWGLFNKNFLTGRPTLSTLQPILTYVLPGQWDIGTSSMIFTYDWRARQLISAPIGFQVGKVFNAGNQPMRAFLETEYNFKDIPGASKFRVLLGLSLLAGR